jgi:hypothetical protein
VWLSRGNLYLFFDTGIGNGICYGVFGYPLRHESTLGLAASRCLRSSCPGSFWQVTALSSKVKSPWNLTSLFFAAVNEAFIAAAMKFLIDCTRESTRS